MQAARMRKKLLLLSFVCISFFLSYRLIIKDGTISKESSSSSSRMLKSITAPMQEWQDQHINYSVQYLPGCEKIHLVFIIQSVRSVVAALRSILFYRHSPLHFHFVSDLSSQTILEKLLVTWELPSVNYSFYPISNAKKKVSWIPSIEHYSLIKLTLPSLLPPSVDRVIVLDNNITIVSDIRGLWAFFNEISEEGKLFAVSEGLHNTFNTEVMLFDLQAMRNRRWHRIWSGLVHKASNTSVHTCHTIINSIINGRHNHYTLPCNWNVHITSSIYIQQCVVDISDYRVIQWNSHDETHDNNDIHEYLLHFQNIYNVLMQYDGDILQDTPITCDKVSSKHSSPNMGDKTCNEIKKQSKQIFRTHNFFYGEEYASLDKYDTTLVTQLSLDRLRLLKKLLKHWNGPISIAMYGLDHQAWELTQYLQTDDIGNRTNVAIHLVYKRGYLYPVNHLRNIALNAVTTPYVFLCDGDFLPNYNLYSLLKKSAKTLMTVSQKRALVVPAFEKLYADMNFPNNKLSLLKQLEKKMIRSFHPLWKHGHKATNYELWSKTSDPYKVEWELYYEPYIMVKSDVARYDQRFIGYGFNKASQIMELRAQGYEFVVLPDAFVVHIPHPPTSVRTDANLMNCVRRMFADFIQSLIMKHGEQFLNFDTTDYSRGDQLALGIERLFLKTRIKGDGRKIHNPLTIKDKKLLRRESNINKETGWTLTQQDMHRQKQKPVNVGRIKQIAN